MLCCLSPGSIGSASKNIQGKVGNNPKAIAEAMKTDAGLIYTVGTYVWMYGCVYVCTYYLWVGGYMCLYMYVSTIDGPSSLSP